MQGSEFETMQNLGQVYSKIWNLQAQKSGQILQVFFLDIFQQ